MIIYSVDPEQIRQELKPHVHLMAIEYYNIRRAWRGPSADHWYKFESMYEMERMIQETINICLDDNTCHSADTTGIHVQFLRDRTYVQVFITFEIVP